MYELFYRNYRCSKRHFHNYEKHLRKSKHDIYANFENMKYRYFKVYDSYYFQNFLHKIRQDIGNFTSRIDFYNILTPIIVQPALNNRRIEAQQGYFIFESFLYNKNISKCINNKFNIINIIIPDEIKNNILSDLDKNYSINYATLFPDYEHVARYINDIYYRDSNKNQDKAR